MTPVVEAISKLPVTGNVTPHVWYQRTEFRSESNRPDRNMITVMADILYWYRPKEIRDEESGGVFVGYERKFQRDMLQYDYGRRAAVFGMSKREMQETCNRLCKAGLIRIDYRTESYRGKTLSNVVYVEPVPEALAVTLTAPNVASVEKAKGAPRGRHARMGDTGGPPFDPNSGVDDQTAESADAGGSFPNQAVGGVSQNSGRGGKQGVSQNFETPLSQNSGGTPPKNWETYHESSLEISSSRDPSSDQQGTGDLLDNALDDEESAGAGKAIVEPPPQSEGSEDLLLSSHDQAETESTKLNRATTLENIPGAADGWAILALRPIPRAELEARTPRDPEGMKILRALMQASSPKRLGHLREQLSLTTGSGLPRELLTRLTDPELEVARAAAQQDAPRVSGGMANAGYHALDRLIGGRVTVEKLTGQRAPQMEYQQLGHAYEYKGAAAGPQAMSVHSDPDAPALDLRTRYLGLWELKSNPDQLVDVVGLEERPGQAPLLLLKAGKPISPTEITLKYRRPEYTQVSA